MRCEKLFQIFLTSMLALGVFAAVASAQTVAPSTTTQSAGTNTATNQSETEKSAATTSSTAKQPGPLSIVGLTDRERLDLWTGKKKTAKSALDTKTSAASYVVPESESEATETGEPQDPKPAAPASNGSNPVDLITRVELKYQFQNFGSGYLHGVPVIRGDYAFSHTVSFRMDLPILIFDPKTPGVRSESGIGDIVTSMTFVKVLSKKFVGAFVPRIDFPTATHASLGSGKYAFKPLIAGVTPLAPGLGFVGVLEYHVSFAGNKNRADISELHIKPIILKSFLSGGLKGYYANPKAEIIVDFENDNHTTLQMGAEFGKALNKKVVVFVLPTIHVAGTKRDNFKLEVGFRYLFR